MYLRRDISYTLQATQNWVSDLAWRLRWHDREQVFRALIATLHALRDCLGRDEAVYIGAQLPALLRGFYYEGWHPGRRAINTKRTSFLDRIHEGLHRDPAVDPEEVARSVLSQFADRLSAAEIEEARAATPKPLHDLWPD
ncbi:MAG: DUF2267 domain-containing protein [Mesorhizobium sp.]|uniref:DUF2267 domain-containing protein n=1 Tax=unclassified Mesorhizobium TaxID=325217 RepID=UPI000F76097B|nr:MULTISPECIES: DUF2267 domain-containing protein [unclassified Mesorhizobium]AZO50262.1 DUF2267 domain-containing protein [Mesorhizobium sp. M4B.F.Ca.ET.058.02.1.1]RWD26570.1 MAG: DUF2267 domain-containing protein [Mesorhizobium sp.]TIW13563.1 MAG: DUF2267 domain-containing protein [Mesorhizobium sp.]TIW37694.1 MAG: DUF2267 domain-containing protein [Mesorhizobium sp.]